MKYKDMKEITIEQWNGEPFLAYTTDAEDNHRVPDNTDIRTVDGYRKGRWLTSGGSWVHVYPVEWNKPTPKRMTNRQLAMWLAKGNGQCKFEDSDYFRIAHSYKDVDDDGKEVPSDIRIRTWTSEEWIEPTTDLLKGYN